MSFRTMLKHRATVKRLVEGASNGYVTHSWKIIAKNVPVFLDLNFIRKGKDAMWTPEAGRRSDRAGVLFAMGTADIRPGDRIFMTKGPTGAFQIEGAVDEAWRPESLDHLEIGVIEVPKTLLGGEEV